MQHYSVKRQVILDCLRSTDTHPTAEWVYAQLKPEYPDLSLATVYRNLSQLKQAGQIQSVGTVLGQERFDGCTAPHTHAVCIRCGKMTDLNSVTIPQSILDDVQEAAGFADCGMSLQFSGICTDCRRKEEHHG